MQQPSSPVVSLVSLGCAKNTVDSECILGSLMSAGIVIAEEPADSDVCLVNTCGFIDSAREEARQTIAEIARLRERGRLKAVVALGCLVERVRDCPELEGFLAGADARVLFGDYGRLPDICRGLAEGTTGIAPPPPGSMAGRRLPASFMRFLDSPRARIGSAASAYLKVAEGCSNVCRFCSIPRIRGLQVSRPIEEILREAEALVASGARELNLIAQDTTHYGTDLYGRRRMADLLRALAHSLPETWIRILYAHPRSVDDELLDAMASEPSVCPYLDLPLQHIADPVLSSMGRGMGRSDTVSLLDQIAARLPGGAIRTTFIVGYPGESDAHFSELLAFVQEARFAHVGVFTYSSEPQTPAARLPDDIPAEVKHSRRDELMKAQLEISRKRLSRRVGDRVTVLVEAAGPQLDTDRKDIVACARSRLEASEVDGLVLLRGRGISGRSVGTFADVKIVDSLDYDVIAERVSAR